MTDDYNRNDTDVDDDNGGENGDNDDINLN